MSSKCNACGDTMHNIQYMECSRIECKKTYDLKCLSISPNVFEAYTQLYKNKWVCPECICLLPKGDNSNTPLRSQNEKFEASNFVNMSRRGGHQISQRQEQDTEYDLVVEIRELRSDITSRFDEQAERFQQVWQIVCEARGEISELQTKIKVLENRVSAFESLEIELREWSAQRHLLSEQLRTHSTLSKPTEHTYSQAASAIATTSSAHNEGEVNTDQGRAIITTPAQANVLTGSMEQIRVADVAFRDHHRVVVVEGDHTANTKTKRKLPAKRVWRGESEGLNVEAIERKKHLHVWRLEPNTTVEQIEKHIENICGSGINVKVEKIVHKTHRDYASFIVGVPEGIYEKICHPKAWPRNAEFGEWIWFRRSTYKPKEGE